MFRRRLALMLLLVLATQLWGGVAFASVCEEPCPDDTETSSCPPVCALCTSCTHAQQGIVQRDVAAPPRLFAQTIVASQSSADSSQHTADIFHVPLLG